MKTFVTTIVAAAALAITSSAKSKLYDVQQAFTEADYHGTYDHLLNIDEYKVFLPRAMKILFPNATPSDTYPADDDEEGWTKSFDRLVKDGDEEDKITYKTVCLSFQAWCADFS